MFDKKLRPPYPDLDQDWSTFHRPAGNPKIEILVALADSPRGVLSQIAFMFAAKRGRRRGRQRWSHSGHALLTATPDGQSIAIYGGLARGDPPSTHKTRLWLRLTTLWLDSTKFGLHLAFLGTLWDCRHPISTAPLGSRP